MTIWIGSLSAGIDTFYERYGRDATNVRVVNHFMAAVEWGVGMPPLTFTIWRLDRLIDRCREALR